jgi:hypothetical protein
MTKRSRVRSLFRTPKLPGWLLFILGAISWIPDWQSRIQFWLAATKQAGREMGVVGSVLASPYFGIGMMVTGLAYLVFVGEAEKVVRRHPIWPILGWVVFGVIAVTFWSLIIVGYAAVHIPKQVDTDATAKIRGLTESNGQLQKEVNSEAAEISELKAKFVPWRLTAEQRSKLDSALSGWTAPPSFKVWSLISNDDSQAHAAEFLDIFLKHGATDPHYMMGLPAGVKGVYIAVNVEKLADVPPAALALGNALTLSDIKFQYVKDLAKPLGLEPHDFALAVGGPPGT